MILLHSSNAKKHTENDLQEDTMKIFACQLCGYEYKSKKGDPDNGVPPGTDFEDIPEDWVCPLCGASKDDFEEIDASFGMG